MVIQEKNEKICKGCSNIPYRFIPSEGPTGAEIVLLGEGPAEHEIRSGRPFVGRAGQLLDSILAASDIPRESVFISNSVRCSDGDPKHKPNKETIDRCSYYWKKEILRVRPKLLITMGGIALQSTGERGAVTSQRGTARLFELDGFSCQLLPTYHPAFLLYGNEGKLPLILSDIHQAKEILAHGPSGVMTAPYRILSDIDEALEYFEILKKSKKFVFDFETTGLIWWKHVPVLLAFCHDGHNGVLLPLIDEEGEYIWSKSERKQIKKGLQRVFREHRGIKIALNLKFDLHYMWRHFGVRPHGWRFADVGVAHHLLDENIPHDLDTLAELYTGFKGYKHMTAKWKTKMMVCPRDILYPYAATDAVATYQLHDRAPALLRREKLQELYDSEMETLRGLFWMENSGILIDPNAFSEVDRTLAEYVGELRSDIIVAAGVEFNPDSHPQLSEVLFGRLGLEPSKKTSKGVASTDKEVLGALEGQHAIIAPLLQYRGVKKLHSTYIKGFHKHIAPDGRAHADFRAEGTVSGRIVCKDPNLLNIPREGKAASIRKLFIAPPGHKIVYCDASQIELMTLAWLSQDKVMLQAFVNGEDIHAVAAGAMYEKTVETITKDQRWAGKTVNFAISYGSEGYSLTKLGFTKEQVVVFMQKYFRRFRGLYRYTKQVPRQAEREGYLVTPFGRKRRCRTFGEMTRTQGRQMLNFPAQSTAAEWVRMCFNELCDRIHRERKQSFPVNFVYDCIMLESPDEEVKWACSALKGVIEHPIPELNGYRFRVEVGVGQSWAEAEANAKK